MQNSINKASKLNPALSPFNVLVGEWNTTGSHPLLPDTILHGHTSFKWMEGGAFLLSHSSVFMEGFPDTISVFGSDSMLGTHYMLTYDERGISRKYELAFLENGFKWWRIESGFSQRYTFTFSQDKNTITGKGELSKDDIHWEKDLDLTYNRIV